jgi:uncharacterized protein (UPF0548 family)
VFSLRKPSQSSIHRGLATAKSLPGSYGIALNTQCGPDELHVPKGFVRDHSRSKIGHGHSAFEASKAAFRQWQQFNLGWVRVANPEAAIELDEIVAVEAHTLGLWTVNYSRILYVIDEHNRFGFGYGTTALHVERGEERFLLEFYPVSGEIYFDLLAVSQPAHWLTWLAYPYTRSRQHKFARDSHAKMAQVAKLFS